MAAEPVSHAGIGFFRPNRPRALGEGETGHDGTFKLGTVRWSVEEALRHEPASSALDG